MSLFKRLEKIEKKNTNSTEQDESLYIFAMFGSFWSWRMLIQPGHPYRALRSGKFDGKIWVCTSSFIVLI